MIMMRRVVEVMGVDMMMVMMMMMTVISVLRGSCGGAQATVAAPTGLCSAGETYTHTH